MTVAEYHHFCFVSDQLVPNYLPVLEEELRASKVTLAVTGKMLPKAQFLQKVLESHNIETEQLLLGKDSSAFDQLQDMIIQWLEENEKDNVILNLTGGTKPMAITAQEAFRMMGKPIFYVDIQTDNVWWLDSNKNANHWEILCQLRHPIDLKTYLKLYGCDVISYKNPSPLLQWRTIAELLAENVLKWQQGIVSLTTHAKQEKSLHFMQDCNQKETKDLVEVLKLNNVIQCKGNTLAFTSDAAKVFMAGGWLEYYIYNQITNRIPNKKNVNRSYLNARIIDSKKMTNEFDVLTVFRGNLYVFECKSGYVFTHENANTAIYKLDALIDKIGGLRSKGILVSCSALSSDNIRRADSYGIQYIGPEDLPPHKLSGKLLNILHWNKERG